MRASTAGTLGRVVWEKREWEEEESWCRVRRKLRPERENNKKKYSENKNKKPKNTMKNTLDNIRARENYHD